MKDLEYHEKTGYLILESGEVFQGKSLGFPKSVSGEIVFNTGMVGYPETLTDPSYHGQILVFTYPLIGNYGIPRDEKKYHLSSRFESERIHTTGVIVSDYSRDYSHRDACRSLSEWLISWKIPALYDIDTRALTIILREKGTVPAKIVFDNQDVPFIDPNERNLVKEVSFQEVIEYPAGKKRIVLIDCGVKNNIIRAFLFRDITVIRCPHDYDFLNLKFDGILISNGPGDPRQCEVVIENIRRAFSLGKPILGVCLGSQILGLAAGARTFKLKYGHRGHNQPCAEMGTRRCFITSQNHGYAIDSLSIPEDWREWFYNYNDRTNEGILHISRPFFGAQFHPEASPGPDDTEFIFDLFVRAIS